MRTGKYLPLWTTPALQLEEGEARVPGGAEGRAQGVQGPDSHPQSQGKFTAERGGDPPQGPRNKPVALRMRKIILQMQKNV